MYRVFIFGWFFSFCPKFLNRHGSLSAQNASKSITILRVAFVHGVRNKNTSYTVSETTQKFTEPLCNLVLYRTHKVHRTILSSPNNTPGITHGFRFYYYHIFFLVFIYVVIIIITFFWWRFETIPNVSVLLSVNWKFAEATCIMSVVWLILWKTVGYHVFWALQTQDILVYVYVLLLFIKIKYYLFFLNLHHGERRKK